VYEAMLAKSECRAALETWLPPASGLRERIRSIHTAYPKGFVRTAAPQKSGGAPGEPTAAPEAGSAVAKTSGAADGETGADGRTFPTVGERPGEESYERAELALRRHVAKRRARLRTRAFVLMKASQEGLI
jgi:hypothetical protein